MKQRRKQLLSLLLVPTIALSLTACSGSTPKETEAPTTEAATEAATTEAETEEATTEAATETETEAVTTEAATTEAAEEADPYAAAADANTDDPYAQAADANTDDPYAQAADANEDDPYAQAADAQETEKATEAVTETETEAVEENYVPEPSADAKYTVTVTDDNWIKIENEDGDTLGLSQTSGVKIIEEDGYAFKDMNQNGKLDVYEDWRKSTEERVEDLVSQMKGEEMAAILTHGGWGSFTTEPLAEDDGSYTYLMQGGRGGVTRSIGQGGEAHAQWTNHIQEVAESCFYGVPAMISIDPSSISGLVETVALGSTMDTELAAKIGETTAKEYRAAGVSALLGPQVDIASPMMSRAGGTYGEDPQLTLDIATAYVNAMQSTYDENGEDIGWGNESVFCFTKHFAGAGATEGGRDDHANGGRYAIFPTNNLEAHLITYFDGVFNLPGKTGSSGIMTQYAIDVDSEGNPIGGEWAGVYNPYLNGMLDEFGYDSLKITDWGVFQFAGVWGAESMQEPERVAAGWEAGANLLGGYGNVENAIAAYNVLVEKDGQEKADEIVGHAAGNFFEVMMNLEMFEEPYSDSAAAGEIVNGDDAMNYGVETQKQSVVMIKNDGTIKEGGNGNDKPTVYVPYVYNTGFSVSWMSGISEGTPSWTPGMDLDKLGQYFNVVTDTLGDPTGEEDADGNKAYTKDDLTRATAEEIAECDYVLVGMDNAYSMSYEALATGALWGNTEPAEGVEQAWYPVSLQYGEYKAETAPETSLAGKTLEDGSKENRSYKGQTAPAAANYGDLEALEYAAEAAGDDIPVIVSMKMERGMVWSEVEPLADVILVTYNNKMEDAVADIVLGNTDPNGLLIFQQPKDMEAVEAQMTDVPRDMECYVDADGNTYDFAFGLNWASVINDERVEKYSAAPLAKVTNFDYVAYAEKNGVAVADAAEEAETEEATTEAVSEEETTEEATTEAASEEETTEEATTEAAETESETAA
ncbi:MAG: glycoside hydrolase family 3 N-terminal domain-containing protein [Eubacteriales bacterium]|nr:glycoside hydrolase family 3 N-terminal domain-containing protein [Eubacteriales bacterium]